MDKPKCKYYSPIAPHREYCGNCAKRIGIWCVEYLMAYSEYSSTEKFKALDLMLRHDVAAALSANAQSQTEVLYAADHNMRVHVVIKDQAAYHTPYSTVVEFTAVD